MRGSVLMVKKEAIIKAVNGLHVRPASTFVKKLKNILAR